MGRGVDTPAKKISGHAGDQVFHMTGQATDRDTGRDLWPADVTQPHHQAPEIRAIFTILFRDTGSSMDLVFPGSTEKQEIAKNDETTPGFLFSSAKHRPQG